MTHHPPAQRDGVTHFKSLVAAQEVEIARLGKIADRLERAGRVVFDEQRDDRPRDADVADLILAGVAQQVQGLYTGIEKVLGSTLDDVDSGKPSGGDWHSQLLLAAAGERDGRPRIISPECLDMLSSIKGFRHLVRHNYSVVYESFRLSKVVDDALVAWRTFVTDWRQFVVDMTKEIEREKDAIEAARPDADEDAARRSAPRRR